MNQYRSDRLSIFLLLVVGMLSCSRVNNGISRLILDCGSDASPAETYLQIKNVDGTYVPGHELAAEIVHSNGTTTAVPVTSRGCVATSRLDHDLLLVRDKVPGRNLGRAFRHADLPLLQQTSLVDISDVEPMINGCQTVQYTRGRVQLSVRWPEGIAEAFPLAVNVKQKGVELLASTLDPLAPSFDIDDQASDGDLDVMLQFRNLFREPGDPKFETSVSCPYRLDRTAPQVTSSLVKRFENGLFRVAPSEKITLQISDEHPQSIRSCLAEADASSAECRDPESFQLKPGSETSHFAPGKGKWCLRYVADDLAGNRSAVHEECFVAFQEAVITDIKQTLTSFRILSAEHPLAATVQLIKALKDYVSLPTAEEKAAVQASLFETMSSRQDQPYREQNR